MRQKESLTKLDGPAKQSDVARLSGVSTATVSLVLAGRTDRVSEATRQKVFEAIRTLNYRAPAMDVRSQGATSRTIGLLAPNLTEMPITRDVIFRSFLDRILTECLFRNWGVLVMAENVWDDHGHSIRRSYDGKCDGVIILGPEEDEMVRPFLERGVPIVQVGITKRTESISCIDVDNAEIGRLTAKVLYDAGHRSFAFIGSQGFTTSVERQEAFEREAKLLGATVTVYESPTWFPRDDLKVLVPKWMEQGVTAAFCWCDVFACYLYKALTKIGAKVPRDMSVVMVEGSLIRNLRPAPTGFNLPFDELAKAAVDTIIHQIETGDTTPRSVRFPARFAARSSVAPPRKS
ncbi:MAG: LacI family DNA-binding transcriptional regulator [Armatimonadetes bacterium]|nr:LacI family DNA-binding transcriptional regulator [Armatimonadota bacterium]